ncbi:short-chain dehydrogenase/reductase [Variovorax paradoxus]|jgi:NAD(P)-dependent dehydrogenase (short-subunit alcohol dehydrogenase family)|uniref:short-chain dehydrogenase/reductase n=1 Tax=Variovorax paradoxus TaxID=34073 RepID=UPI001ABCC099
MKLGLEGKSVAVTGASKGIGEGLVRAFAAEGAHVHLIARTRAGLDALAGEMRERFPGQRFEVHAGDLAQAPDRARVAEAIREVDVLVNNAGAIPGGSVDEITTEQLRQAWELKVFGYIDLSRAAYLRMRERGSGVILNNIGNSGAHVDAAYIAGSAGNASLIAFTKALGGPSLDHGVRVLGVNPGPVRTERMVTLMRNRALRTLGDAQRHAELQAHLPAARPASVAEVADVIVFLASERASYVSGTVLTIDGGAGSRGSIYAR